MIKGVLAKKELTSKYYPLFESMLKRLYHTVLGHFVRAMIWKSCSLFIH